MVFDGGYGGVFFSMVEILGNLDFGDGFDWFEVWCVLGWWEICEEVEYEDEDVCGEYVFESYGWNEDVWCIELLYCFRDDWKVDVIVEWCEGCLGDDVVE